MSSSRYVLAAALLFTWAPSSASFAATLFQSRTGTNDIVIPHFNPSLGTLQSVSLNISLLSGQSSPDGNHVHGVTPLTVTGFTLVQSSSAGAISFPTTQRTSTVENGSSHFGATPNYSGGGINVGSFPLSTTSSGSHSHQVQISYGGANEVVFNPFGNNTYQVRATMQVLGVGPHQHGYSAPGKSLNYFGAGTNPFVTTSDIVIPAGSFPSTPSPSHSHLLPSYTVLVQSSTGSTPVVFPQSVFNGAGGHNHLIDPRFSTTAVFTYTPVPEPSALMLGAAALGCVVVASRRRAKRLA